ncbi:DUF4465 domain-containing protein [Flammeovirga sp. SJP92]|uniref:DUF4465 domain-containing protein n=1 Tax=Flammeovirga sp. SJP92 TaxID=1775430 RepID=UPI000792A76A|nr:DUF4465 domain-containing protein [Flammeovirga sp. SJP92]KXX67699.1 hypothetical protein AVL50_24825 [Flammeovirga sp. SJP92]
MEYYKYTFVLLFLIALGCGVEEITGPRLELTIVSPKVNPVTAQALVTTQDTVVYEARVRGGDTTSYQWIVDGEVIANGLVSEPIMYTEEGQHIARFFASNENYESFAEILINVINKIATFEDLPLEDYSFWIGSGNTEPTTFNSGGIDFLNTPPSDTTEYANFGYSNIIDSTKTDFVEYGAYILTQSRNQFGIARMDTLQEDIKITFDTLYSPLSISLANSPKVVRYARGDISPDSAFTNGDYFDVVIKGINNDGSITSDSVATRMIDRSAFSLTVVGDWTPIDLSALGKVRGLQFSINTTAVHENTGIEYIDKRFCIDDLVLIENSERFNNTP